MDKIEQINLKVIMVGNVCVGKTPLGLVLTGQEFPSEYIPTVCKYSGLLLCIYMYVAT